MAKPEWIDDPHMEAGDDEAAAVLSEMFTRQPAQQWEDQLLAVDVACVSATRTWVEFLFSGDRGLPDDFVTSYDSDTHGVVEQCGLAMNLSETPGFVGPLDSLGGSTQHILTELGYDENAIRALRADAVVRPDE